MHDCNPDRVSKTRVAATLLVAGCLGVSSVSRALLDPAPVYCKAMGYEFVLEETEGGEMGVCILPNGSQVNAQEFLSGQVARQWSYCEQNGYQSKAVDDPAQCRDCLVCVLANGDEVEVTKLMGLGFEETKCGDGSCGIPENSQTCPADCPVGGWDGLCDGVPGDAVDPDCTLEEGLHSDGFESGDTSAWSKTVP